MSVCVVILVYDHKKPYLKQIVKRVKELGVQKLIIINNSHQKLFLDNTFQDGIFVKLIHTTQNLGSAGGYSIGMQYAADLECDFIWLLDEDNLPNQNSLSILLTEWELQISSGIALNELMLLPYRPQLFGTLNPRIENNRIILTPAKNSFLGNHISQLPNIILKRTVGQGNDQLKDLLQKEKVEINSGYYGGLFFHKSFVKVDSLPKNDFFIYWDDIEFTFRFIKKGGKILLLPKCVISDLDNVYNDKIRSKFLSHPIYDLNPSFKAYHFIRNVLRVEEMVGKSSGFTFICNKYTFLFIMYIIAVLRGKKNRFRLIGKAIQSLRKSNKVE